MPPARSAGSLKPIIMHAALANLVQVASSAAQNAYAPYSRFRVGAALLLESGAIASGCNVENSSYGLANCAERTALFRAVAEHGPGLRVAMVAVANLNKSPSPPCGACRQALSEFVTEDAVVVFPGAHGIVGSPVPFRELFPHSFRLNLERQ